MGLARFALGFCFLLVFLLHSHSFYNYYIVLLVLFGFVAHCPEMFQRWVVPNLNTFKLNQIKLN